METIDSKFVDLQIESMSEVHELLRTGRIPREYQYPIYFSLTANEREQILESVKSYIGKDRPSILEMGCSDAIFLLNAYRLNYDCTGFELREPLIDIARKNIVRAHKKGIIDIKNGPIKIIHGDMLNPESYYANNIYPKAFDLYTVVHEPNLEQRSFHFFVKYAKVDSFILTLSPRNNYHHYLNAFGNLRAVIEKSLSTKLNLYLFKKIS